MTRADGLAVAAASAGCFLLYLVSAAPGTYWLDSSELAAAGFGLGVAHPPGHPLWALLAKAVTLVPIGGVAFRINVLSGLGGAACCGLVAAISLRLVRARHPGAQLAPALAAAGGLLLGASSALWLQSVRAEVYTPHTAAMLLVVWLAVRWGLADETGDDETWRGPAPVALASLVVGLSLASHHYLVLFVAPALVALLLADPRGRALVRTRPALLVLPAAAGLLTYAYLPVRAAADPAISWASPTTAGRLWDVISARTFQASVTETGDNDVLANLGEELLLLMSQLHPMVVVVGLGGLAALALRWGPRWGGFFGLLLLGNLLSTAIMRFDPTNPDAHGYLQLSHAVVVIAAVVLAARVAAGLSVVGRRGAAVVVGGGLLLGAVAGIARQLAEHGPRADLRSFAATEIMEDAQLSLAPPGALVLPSYYSLLFVHWYAQQVDGRRPDVTVVQQSFDAKIHGGVPYTEALLSHHPRWRAIFEAYLRERATPWRELLAAAEAEPVLVEPELALPVPTQRLRGLGLLAEVTDGPTEPPPELAERWDALEGRLAQAGGAARETQEALLWSHFRAATMYLRQTHVGAALDATQRAQAIAGRTAGVQRLAGLVERMLQLPADQRAELAAELDAGDLGALVGP